ncbi:MAG: spore maturation protein [Clostridiales bacterium]|nr:spore maturation protein [Clostridiales bacterium]
MSSVVQIISGAFIPAVISIILIYGMIKKQDVYSLFIKGCMEGLMTALEIVPYILAIFIAIDIFKSSGALLFFQEFMEPVFDFLKIPTELFPMIAMKPVSGSGSLAILEKLIEECGPDSYVARVGCVMLGSSETIFYTLAVYFGATAVKRGRYTLFAGMMAFISGTAAAIVLCNFI